VNAVATAVLPGGRPVAVTGGVDATVRVWDLAIGVFIGELLPTPNTVSTIAVSDTRDGLCIVMVGGGIAVVDFRP